jgi:hypothetical protein
LICASSVGCQFNLASKRRQGGKEKRNFDLLIKRDADIGGDVDMAVGGEKPDQDEQGTCQQRRQAELIQPRQWLLCSEILALCHHRSERDPNRSSDGTQVPVKMVSVERLMRGSQQRGVSDDGLELRTREQG